MCVRERELRRESLGIKKCVVVGGTPAAHDRMVQEHTHVARTCAHAQKHMIIEPRRTRQEPMV